MTITNSAKSAKAIGSRNGGIRSLRETFIATVEWFDKNLLTLLTAVLIIVIPLYPKIPLGELIEGYIVRLRLEDLLIFFTFAVWLVQLARRRITLPKHRIVKAIYAYFIVAILSTLSALFITRTVPFERAHVFKLFFHLFRRVEYFSLFFIAYSAIRSKSDLKLFIKLAFATLIGVIIYGIGQKYFYFPAFSTMNREFSKGVLLYLQPNTRLFSTFGGHYDLAAYLLLMLSFTIPAAWMVKAKKHKAILYLVSLFAVWSLVLTTSRTSFIGYLVGITLSGLWLTKDHKFFWAFKRVFLIVTTSLIIMLFFSTLVERFAQVIPNRETRDAINTLTAIINKPFINQPESTGNVAELPSLLGFLFKNEKPVIIPVEDVPEDQLALVASKSDMPPSPVKPTPQPIEDLPSDVTQESENIRKQTAEEQGKEYGGPSYSQNALKYGLSMAIRLDELWPRALAGFMTNPLLGTGYSTLVKSNLGEFTYAESTDNDYLRMLGETGLLGAITFLSIIYFAFQAGKLAFDSPDQLSRIIGVGLMTAIVSILVNALYIDVFESSKVAYTIWIMVALVVRLNELNHPRKIGKKA